MRAAAHAILACVFISAAGANGQAVSASPDALLEIHKPVERQLSEKEIHSYRIGATKGQFISGVVEQRGIDVVVTVFDPAGKSLSVIDSPNGDSGDEPFSILAKTSGMYRLEIKPFESANSGRYSARVDEVLSPDQYRVRLAEEKADIAIVSKWLGANAIPLRTVAAGAPTDDLQPLKAVLRNVRIVALGEATHGTREFFQAKHRLLEFLVKEMGFRTFAIEASQAGSAVIDDYVMDRMSDGPAALASQGFWTWNTEEVLEQLNWMRSYNRAMPADRKVRFIGFDHQVNQRGAESLLAYLRKFAPDRALRLSALPSPRLTYPTPRDTAMTMEMVAEAAASGPAEKRPAAIARMSELRSAFNELLGYLTLHEFDLIGKSSAAEYADAVRHARLIAQNLEAYSSGTGWTSRDEFMAENIVRIINALPADSRVVVWAHNGHIEKAEPSGTSKPMGAVLASIYGERYYALGFAFNQGSFQARSTDPKAKFALSPFVLGAAPEKSIEWYYAMARIPVYIVDFRHTGRNPAVSRWLSKTHPMRIFGSTSAGATDPLGVVNPVRQFDGMLFVDKTTRARPNPSVPNVAR